MFTKYTRVEEILETKYSNERMEYSEDANPGDGLQKFAAMHDATNSDGYLYVKCRAISSRVNKNNDGWPSEELAKSYKSFIGRPIFVDHNNDDPDRTRGVIVDSRLIVQEDKESSFDPYYSTAPDNHKPPTYIELLLEVDAKTFPRLAKAVRNGDIDAVSMGANIKRSSCSVCAHEALTPQDYCEHIKNKGATFEIVADNGDKVSKKAYEDCHDINFFEISFVFDPADPTALISSKTGHDKTADNKTSFTMKCHHCKYELGKDDIFGSNCPDCGNLLDPLGIEIGDPDIIIETPWPQTVPDFPPEVWPEETPEEPEREKPVKEPEKVPAGKKGAKHKDDCECGFCVRMRENIKNKKSKPPVDSQAVRDNRISKVCPSCNGSNVDKVLKEEWDNDNLYSCLDCKKNYRYKQASPGDLPKEIDRVLNHEPQSEQLTAPQEVDTLRKEITCPKCKADNLVTESDGQMKCPKCQYVQPPHPLDSPDLTMHQQVNELSQKEDETASGDPLDQIKIFPSGGEKQGISHNTTNKKQNPKDTIDRMKWTTISNEASVETSISNPNGVTIDTYNTLKRHNLIAKITYPDGESTVIPFDSPVKDMGHILKAQKLGGFSNPSEIPIVVQASLKDIEDVLEIIHTGAFRPQKKIINPSVSSKTDDPKDVKVVSDQYVPVTSDNKETEEMEKETQEIAEVTAAEVEVFEPEVEDESRLLHAFKLVEDLVELGAISAQDKFAHVANFEKESLEVLNARLATLELVKQAGLSKPAPKVASLLKMPSLTGFNVETSAEDDDIDFQQVFV